MTPLDLLGLCIVCATALGWHAISRHYAGRDQRQREDFVERCAVHAAASLHDAQAAAEFKREAQAAAETATSVVAQREYAKLVMRMENLEARVRR